MAHIDAKPQGQVQWPADTMRLEVLSCEYAEDRDQTLSRLQREPDKLCDWCW